LTAPRKKGRAAASFVKKEKSRLCCYLLRAKKNNQGRGSGRRKTKERGKREGKKRHWLPPGVRRRKYWKGRQRPLAEARKGLAGLGIRRGKRGRPRGPFGRKGKPLPECRPGWDLTTVSVTRMKRGSPNKWTRMEREGDRRPAPTMWPGKEKKKGERTVFLPLKKRGVFESAVEKGKTLKFRSMSGKK